jgi:hypothetical protein
MWILIKFPKPMGGKLQKGFPHLKVKKKGEDEKEIY